MTEFTKGKLFIVTTSKPTAGGWIDPGKHLLRIEKKMQQRNRTWSDKPESAVLDTLQER